MWKATQKINVLDQIWNFMDCGIEELNCIFFYCIEVVKQKDVIWYTFVNIYVVALHRDGGMCQRMYVVPLGSDGTSVAVYSCALQIMCKLQVFSRQIR